LKLEPDDTPTHDSSRRTFTTRDHPPPQRASPVSRPRPRDDPVGAAAAVVAHNRILSNAAADDNDAGGQAIVLQYRRLLHAIIVTIYTFCEVRSGCL